MNTQHVTYTDMYMSIEISLKRRDLRLLWVVEEQLRVVWSSHHE